MNKNLTFLKFPKLSWALSFIGFIYLFVSIMQFGVKYYDLSQLIPNIAVSCAFFILAYIYWYFRFNDANIVDIHKDFQAFDKKINDLEVKFIDFKNRGEGGN